MALRDYVPGLGDHSARQRWRELRRDALALDVLAALAVTKWIEQNVALAAGVDVWGQWAAWLALSVLLMAAHVYRVRLEEAAEQAKETVEEVTDE